jgi:hypothetical protein
MTVRTATTRRIARQIISKIPTFKTISRKICPPGEILRKGYTRHYSTAVRKRGITVRKANGQMYRIHPTQKNVHVSARCIKDPGPEGRSRTSRLIGPLREGELAKYGYSFRRPDTERQIALVKAIQEYSALSVFHKLDAIAKLTSRTLPRASAVFTKDREWVRSKFMKT